MFVIVCVEGGSKWGVLEQGVQLIVVCWLTCWGWRKDEKKLQYSLSGWLWNCASVCVCVASCRGRVHHQSWTQLFQSNPSDASKFTSEFSLRCQLWLRSEISILWIQLEIKQQKRFKYLASSGSARVYGSKNWRKLFFFFSYSAIKISCY